MSVRRLVVPLLVLPVLFGAVSVRASEAEQRALYGRALANGELGWACFSRRYDDAHLRAHPKQNVMAMVVLAYRPDWPGAESSIVNFEVRVRGAPEPVQLSGECRAAGGGGLACGFECDGGTFGVKTAGSGAILIDLPAPPGLCDGEDDAGGPGFGPDDRRFRLDRVGIDACRDLVWDDELRPRLLRAAGQ